MRGTNGSSGDLGKLVSIEYRDVLNIETVEFRVGRSARKGDSICERAV